jgi:hypothetical protein
MKKKRVGDDNQLEQAPESKQKRLLQLQDAVMLSNLTALKQRNIWASQASWGLCWHTGLGWAGSLLVQGGAATQKRSTRLGWPLRGGELPQMVPIKVVCAKDSLERWCKIQEAQHRAIVLDDVKETLAAMKKKHMIETGTWAHDASIALCLGFAATEMNVKLTNGVVQANTNTRHKAESSLMRAMSFVLVQAMSSLVVGEPCSKPKSLKNAADGA